MTNPQTKLNILIQLSCLVTMRSVIGGVWPPTIAFMCVLLKTKQKKSKFHSFIVSLEYLQMIQSSHPISRNMKILYNKNLHIITTRWHISIFANIVSKIVRVPVCVGGGRAAIGSNIAYKVEDSTNYAMDKLASFKKIFFSNSIKEYILICDF